MSTSEVADVTAQTPPRRRARWRIGAAASIAVIGFALAACTPSGYAAERAATARVNHELLGHADDPGAVQCGEFENSGGRFHGICTVYGVSYAVSSNYTGDSTAAVTVGRWGGASYTCPVVKTPSGQWLVWTTNDCGT